jgi:Ca2+:H+ antiporter
MAVQSSGRLPWWSWTWPGFAFAILGVKLFVGTSPVLSTIAGIVLMATVFSAVYHAEIVAHKVGEPMGTIVLAVAVTVIEVALIVSALFSGGTESVGLPRDTVFAAVMIVCNGIVGLCLLVGGVKHFEQGFQLRGANAALAVLASLTTLTMVLPNFTTSNAGPVFNPPQLLFAGAASLILYSAFIFVQTVRHRDYFLPEGGPEEIHAEPPSGKTTALSSGLLLVSLIAVVTLAKLLTPTIEKAIEAAGVPRAVVGIVIAGLVLLPEGLAAVRAARQNRLQTSLNLALGSALASIGLTIPAVAVVSIMLHLPLSLGLTPTDMVLLFLTLLVSVITLGTGRTSVLQGIVHLVILAAFLFLALVP